MSDIELFNENIATPYGLIQVQKNIELLQNHCRKNKICTLPVLINHTFITVLDVQGEYAFCKGKYDEGIQEYNDTLRFISGEKNARWRFREREYKFNIVGNMEAFFLLFDHLELEDYDVSRYPQIFNSSETMFYKRSDSYFSLLQWEGDRDYNAIKIKKNIVVHPILERDTMIFDYNSENFNRTLNLFGQGKEDWEKYKATFQKKKKRHIVIDKKTGHIFGVSCNISHVFEKLFCQVEVEYWSRITPTLSFKILDTEKDRELSLSSHLRLLDKTRDFLRKNNISFNEEQLVKNKWLQRIRI